MTNTENTDRMEKAHLLSLVSAGHRTALTKAIEFQQNPTQETAEAVAEVMDGLFEIKMNMKKCDGVIKELDDVIKFAVRSTVAFPTTQKFFDVKPAHKSGKIKNPIEMLSRLMKIFNDPMEFSSCIEFNYNNLKNLMGDRFIEENADLIIETETAPAVYLQKGIENIS